MPGEFFIARHVDNPPNTPVHLPVDEIKEMDQEEDVEDEGDWWSETSYEGQDDMDDSEEGEEGQEEVERASSELNESEAGSRRSTPATAISEDTAETATTLGDDDDDDDGIHWAHNPSLKLRALEELRGDFISELQDPSAWLLHRFATLTEASGEFGPQETVRLWYEHVVHLTYDPAEGRLLLLPVIRPESTPFYTAITWEQADSLVGEARESCFGRNVEEVYKQAARLSIDFLVPDARTKGLSGGDKKRMFTVASSVWAYDPPRAQGLLWVLDKEYPYTRQEAGREWANDHSEAFMVYTVLYPPPIVATRNSFPERFYAGF